MSEIAVKRELLVASKMNKELQQLIAAGQTFGTIYADPPWAYANTSTRASAKKHYRTMTVSQIAELPVEQVAAESCHLHLWTTNAFLFDSERIIEAWGFEYRSCYVWVKPQMGIGNYWRVSHEFLLLGVRGQFRFDVHNQKSWGEFRRTKHSEKPDKVRHILEQVSPSPRLELFSRRLVPGWTCLGDQVSMDLFSELSE